MPLYLVTVKLPRQPGHDPGNKITGPCVAAPSHVGEIVCTDATGEHHTYLVEATDRDTAAAHGRALHGHVTRVEDTYAVGSAKAVIDAWFRLPHGARSVVAGVAPDLAAALIELRKLAAP